MDEGAEAFNDIHVIPLNDCIEHEDSWDCECGPYWDEKNQAEFEMGLADRRVCVHKMIKAERH